MQHQELVRGQAHWCGNTRPAAKLVEANDCGHLAFLGRDQRVKSAAPRRGREGRWCKAGTEVMNKALRNVVRESICQVALRRLLIIGRHCAGTQRCSGQTG